MFSKGFDKRRDREALQELRAVQNRREPIVAERPLAEMRPRPQPAEPKKLPLLVRLFGRSDGAGRLH